MNRRTVALVLAVFSFIVLLSFAILALYPFTVENIETDLQRHSESEYHVSAEIVTDGELDVRFNGSVSENGPSFRVVESTYIVPWSKEEQYQNGSLYYTRITVDANETGPLEEIQTDLNGDVLSQHQSDGQLFTVLKASDPEKSVLNRTRNSEEYLLTGLETIQYQETRQQNDTIVLEPESGWYRDSRPGADAYHVTYHVTGTSGEVHIDSTSGAVVYADVEFTRTEASSYLEYLLSDDQNSITISVKYDVTAESVDLQTPDWVGEIQSNQTEQ